MDFQQPVLALIPGVRGKILRALVEAGTEMSGRSIARLAEVSESHAGRILRNLEHQGVISRRDVGNSSQFRLVHDNVLAEVVVDLARSQERARTKLAEAAERIDPPPTAVVVFGSFERGEAMPDSDLDVLIVRSNDTDEDDPGWLQGVDRWLSQARRITGLEPAPLELSETTVRRLVRAGEGIWSEIAVAKPLIGHLPTVRRRRAARTDSELGEVLSIGQRRARA